MSIQNTQEWQEIKKSIETRKEKILKKILTKNPSLNEVKFSLRDLYITEIEMFDYFLNKPQDIVNYKNNINDDENL
ncbi:MAG: hypothetical protein ACTTH6_01895 [Candidatus Altimarinota bacterium]